MQHNEKLHQSAFVVTVEQIIYIREWAYLLNLFINFVILFKFDLGDDYTTIEMPD